MTFPKHSFLSKSISKWLRYHQKNLEKHLFLVKIKQRGPAGKHFMELKQGEGCLIFCKKKRNYPSEIMKTQGVMN
jgi:hypothetical protein